MMGGGASGVDANIEVTSEPHSNTRGVGGGNSGGALHNTPLLELNFMRVRLIYVPPLGEQYSPTVIT